VLRSFSGSAGLKTRAPGVKPSPPRRCAGRHDSAVVRYLGPRVSRRASAEAKRRRRTGPPTCPPKLGEGGSEAQAERRERDTSNHPLTQAPHPGSQPIVSPTGPRPSQRQASGRANTAYQAISLQTQPERGRQLRTRSRRRCSAIRRVRARRVAPETLRRTPCKNRPTPQAEVPRRSKTTSRSPRKPETTDAVSNMRWSRIPGNGHRRGLQTLVRAAP
jgi:hypothetical protein